MENDTTAGGPDDRPETEHDASRRGARERVSDGIRQGLGVLTAFRDALEETINEARERGDLSTDRAREVMRSALSRAQEAAEDAKERLDFVPQREFDALRVEVDALKARVAALEGGAASPPPPTDAPVPD